VVYDAPREGIEATCDPVPGRISEVMWMEKSVLVQMLTRLGLPVSAELKRRLRRPATASFDAFLAFSRGVEAEDLGRTADAVRAYGEASRLDPGFRLARERHDALNVISGEMARVDQVAWSQSSSVESQEDRSDRSLEELGFVPRGSSMD